MILLFVTTTKITGEQQETPKIEKRHKKRPARKSQVFDLQVVPEAGVEPAHPYGYQILSLARLPFRHSGNQWRLI